jgi:glycosyltransferase
MNKVTVIIVTYNSEKTIIDCLKSIYSQKYYDFKTKIVDNNSTDQTASFAETVSRERLR